MGQVVSVNLSLSKGTVKSPVATAELVAGLGLHGDAHAGPGARQVSLLMAESIEALRELMVRRLQAEPERPRDPRLNLAPGAFAENLTVTGISLLELAIGDQLAVGDSALLQVTRIGKQCHHGCAIFETLGDCIMPREGIFCEVVRGGSVRAGDRVVKR